MAQTLPDVLRECAQTLGFEAIASLLHCLCLTLRLNLIGQGLPGETSPKGGPECGSRTWSPQAYPPDPSVYTHRARGGWEAHSAYRDLFDLFGHHVDPPLPMAQEQQQER